MDLGSIGGISANQVAAKSVNLSTPSVAQGKEAGGKSDSAAEEASESRAVQISEGEIAGPAAASGVNQATNPEAALASGKTKGVSLDVST